MNPDQTYLGPYCLQYWLPNERVDDKICDWQARVNIVQDYTGAITVL